MQIEDYYRIGNEIKADRLKLEDFEITKTKDQIRIEYYITNGRGYARFPSSKHYPDVLQTWLFMAEKRDEFNASEISAKRRITVNEYMERFHTSNLKLYNYVMGEMDKDEILTFDFIRGIGKPQKFLEIVKEFYGKKPVNRKVIRIKKTSYKDEEL